MRTVIYECDKCGHEQQNDDEGMYKIELRVATFTYSSPLTGLPKQTVLWCARCTQQVGFVKTPKLPKEEQPKPITIDDLIKDMVIDALEEQL